VVDDATSPRYGWSIDVTTMRRMSPSARSARTGGDRWRSRVESLRGRLLPRDVHVAITRDYGHTAREKSNELLKHLLLATVSVTVLIALFLGLRASLVVLVAIPVTLALTLFLYYLYGYTLNRVTLFALIFSIGILVDDAIVMVENIARHYALPGNARRSLRDVAVGAVAEVGRPASWTSTGTWRRPSRSTGSSSIRRRRR
jgi:multidrug efflux pump subunit AcrB